ncbi:MAG: HypC/HybG/HupF family hydrogenase formation chaperone [Planctomycetota bacterium]
MCLAIPARIVQLDADVAVVDLAGNRRRVNVSLLDRPVLGDYVLVHAGFAITRLSRDEAEETLEALGRLEKMLADDGEVTQAASDD